MIAVCASIYVQSHDCISIIINQAIINGKKR